MLRPRRSTVVTLLVILTPVAFVLATPNATAQAGASEQSQSQPKRPQLPKEPFPYESREVSYPNPSDGTVLAGMLTSPKSSGPFPAVILVPGSGPMDRDASMAGHKPFLVLADYLTRNGLAVLRVDSRGVGASSGKYLDATGEDFAADVLAGIAFLKKQPGIAAPQIGVIGHSLGGVVGPIAAARSADVNFLVLLAAPGLPDKDNVVLRIGYNLRAKGLNDNEVRRYQDMYRDLHTRQIAGAEDETVRDLLRALTKVMYPPGMELSPQQLESLVEQQVITLRSPFAKFFISHDPREVLKRVRCPVMALHGSLDQGVPPAENLAAIDKALREGGNRDRTVVELYGLNHLLQTASTGSPVEFAEIEETISPQALELLTAWIRSHTSHAAPGKDHN